MKPDDQRAAESLAAWDALSDIEQIELADEEPGDGLEECSNCHARAFADELRECANSVPGHGRGPFHCWDCAAGGCCGACQDEDAREHQAEQAADIARFGP